MIQDQYRREMECRLPRKEALEHLYEMTEGGSNMRQIRRLSPWAAAVIAACALLTVTAAAATAPAVWEALTSHLGRFAPYAQTIQATACTDQGIEVQVLSALSDDLETRVYLSVRDTTEDRLDGCLRLEGRLSLGERGLPSPDGTPQDQAASAATSHFTLLSYDPETKTALLSASIHHGVWYGASGQIGQSARLTLTGLTTQGWSLHSSIIGTAIPAETLESLPAEAGSQVLLTPSDIIGLGYTDAILPQERLVLAPEQNPMALPGTEDMWVSSIGFAGDGCLHLRLGLSEGVQPESFFTGDVYLPKGDSDDRWYTSHVLLLPDGVDILFPLIKSEDLPRLSEGQVRVYGGYTRPGTAIQGSWTASFRLEHHASRPLSWTGELAGRQVTQVRVSPLSVVIYSSDQGGFADTPLVAVKKDGTTVSAQPDIGRYGNTAGASETPVWDTVNTWKFEEPVDVEDIASLTLLGESIPVD